MGITVAQHFPWQFRTSNQVSQENKAEDTWTSLPQKLFSFCLLVERTVAIYYFMVEEVRRLNSG
jgi:hypothetical protein